MSNSRPKHTKPDLVQNEIVKDLRDLGFDVDIVANLAGLYDLIVSGRRDIHFQGGSAWVICSVRVEVKTGPAKLTKSEYQYYNKQIHKHSYIIARSTEDIINWFNGSNNRQEIA